MTMMAGRLLRRAVALILLVILSIAIGPNAKAQPAQGPNHSTVGVDCAIDNAESERAVCQSARLSELDRELNSIYFTVLKNTQRSQRADLINSQREWLRLRNNCKDDEACISSVYEERIKELRTRLSPSSEAASVHTPATPSPTHESAEGRQSTRNFEIVPLTPHAAQVGGIAFSPDGKQILSGSADDTVKLWDAATGRLLRTFFGHTFPVGSVAFSPDGRRAISGSRDGTIKLWDVVTGKLLRTTDATEDRVLSVAFSPDGKMILSGDRLNEIKLWNTATGRLIHTFSGHSQGVSSVAFSPDGTRVFSGSHDHTIKVWDTSTARLIRTLSHGTEVYEIAVSRDGSRVLSAGGTEAKLWEVSTGRLVRTFAGQSGDVGAVALSADGASALIASGKTLTLWRLDTGALLRTFEGHSDDVLCVTFSPDGKQLASGSSDNTMKVWDAATGQLVRTFTTYSGNVVSLALSRDGTRLIFGIEDSGIRLWDAHAGRLIGILQGDPRVSTFSPDGSLVVSGGEDNSIILWSAPNGQQLRSIAAHSERITALAFSADGARLFSGSADKTIKLWNAGTGELTRSFGPNSKGIESITLSSDGARLLSRSDAWKLWDVDSGRLVRDFADDAASVLIEFSPNGEFLLSADSPGTGNGLQLWDARTGQLVRTFLGHTDSITSIAFSPDGARFISGSADKTLKLWNVHTGELLRTFVGHSDQIDSLAFSSDETRVVSSGTEVKLWDTTSGGLIRSLAATEDEDQVGAWSGFSPDATRVLAGGSINKGMRTIKLWDARNGRLLRTITWPGHIIWTGSSTGDLPDDAIRGDGGHLDIFAPAGTPVFSGSDDTTIKVWSPKSGELLAMFTGDADGEWLSITSAGFFASSPKGTQMLAAVRGLEVTLIDQVHQSLFSPDLVREALAGDPNGEVERASEFINLDKVLDSGPAPHVEITDRPFDGKSDKDLVTVAARITDRGKGIGRIEWRVNGVTTAVMNAQSGTGPEYEVKQTLALDRGKNAIEVVAYNARNLLASLPAQTTIIYNAPADAEKPKLYVLAIGINSYHDDGWTPPGATKREYFPPLKLAVDDARSIGETLKVAGSGFYGQVIVRPALDEEATATGLERIVQEISTEINPRDTFVLFAAAHGYSNNGHFYLLPQDYEGGTDPSALIGRAIGQDRLQDWIANRIKARRAIILLDTCESGALTNGYAHSRTDAPASEAAVGRLHEATGRPVLTAAAAGKPAFEGYHGHGVFTWALIDALFHGDTNGDGLIELSELAAHVQNTVPKISAEMNGRGIAEVLTQIVKYDRQTAHFGSTGGDFPVVRRLQ
jgi:WD40 repeat protein